MWDRKTGEIETSQAAGEQRAAQVRALELEVANGIAAARRRVALLEEQSSLYGRDTQPVIDRAERDMAQGFEEGRVDAKDLLLVEETMYMVVQLARRFHVHTEWLLDDHA